MSRIVIDGVDENLHREFRIRALREGTTMAAVLRECIARYTAGASLWSSSSALAASRAEFTPGLRRLTADPFSTPGDTVGTPA